MKKRTVVAVLLVLAILAVSAFGYWLAKQQEDSGAVPLRDEVSIATVSLQFGSGGEVAHGATDSLFVAASQELVKAFSQTGEEVYSGEVALNSPVVDTAGSYALAYDRGGTNLQLLDGTKTAYTIAVDETIQLAQVSESGNALVVTSGGLHKSAVRVLDKKGNEVFKWNTGGLYVLAGDIASNGNDIAISTLDAAVAGGKGTVYLFNTGKSTPTASDDLGSSLITNLEYTGGNWYGFADGMLLIYSGAGKRTGTVSYPDRMLMDYALDGPLAVLAFSASENGINSRGTTVEAYNVRGECVGQTELSNEAGYLDCLGGRIAVQDGEQVAVLNSKCVRQFDVDVLSDINDLLLMRGGKYGVAVSNATADIIQIG